MITGISYDMFLKKRHKQYWLDAQIILKEKRYIRHNNIHAVVAMPKQLSEATAAAISKEKKKHFSERVSAGKRDNSLVEIDERLIEKLNTKLHEVFYDAAWWIVSELIAKPGYLERQQCSPLANVLTDKDLFKYIFDGWFDLRIVNPAEDVDLFRNLFFYCSHRELHWAYWPLPLDLCERAYSHKETWIHEVEFPDECNVPTLVTHHTGTYKHVVNDLRTNGSSALPRLNMLLSRNRLAKLNVVLKTHLNEDPRWIYSLPDETLAPFQTASSTNPLDGIAGMQRDMEAARYVAHHLTDFCGEKSMLAHIREVVEDLGELALSVSDINERAGAPEPLTYETDKDGALSDTGSDEF